jgi:hypothetical protein
VIMVILILFNILLLSVVVFVLIYKQGRGGMTAFICAIRRDHTEIVLEHGVSTIKNAN